MQREASHEKEAKARDGNPAGEEEDADTAATAGNGRQAVEETGWQADEAKHTVGRSASPCLCLPAFLLIMNHGLRASPVVP